MVNFLWLDKNFCKKPCAAIKELVVPDMLPQSNLLSLMQGLDRVLIAGSDKLPSEDARGWYKVVKTEKGRVFAKQGFLRGG